ncbi:MAG: hypothetical protein WC783_00475 [Candidatus Paceibacterota bacterium]|jgi:hypothetical protein
MIKYFCDTCEKEINSFNTINYLCHIADNDNISGYIDESGNKVSGREESVQVCHKCYNEIMGKMYKEIERLRKENNIKEDKTQTIKSRKVPFKW